MRFAVVLASQLDPNDWTAERYCYTDAERRADLQITLDARLDEAQKLHARRTAAINSASGAELTRLHRSMKEGRSF
jgi:hypothetical protein